jgi:hypothetical protein
MEAEAIRPANVGRTEIRDEAAAQLGVDPLDRLHRRARLGAELRRERAVGANRQAEGMRPVVRQHLAGPLTRERRRHRSGLRRRNRRLGDVEHNALRHAVDDLRGRATGQVDPRGTEADDDETLRRNEKDDGGDAIHAAAVKEDAGGRTVETPPAEPRTPRRHARLHQVDRAVAQDLALARRERLQMQEAEADQIFGRRVDRARRGGIGLVGWQTRAVPRIPKRLFRRERRRHADRAAGHPQRPEHVTLEIRIEADARDLRDHVAEDRVAKVRVEKLLAGRDDEDAVAADGLGKGRHRAALIRVEHVLIRRETGGVAGDAANRGLTRRPGIAVKREAAQVGLDRRVEVDLPPLDQGHQRGGADRFRHRRQRVHRLRRRANPALLVRIPPGARPQQPSILPHRHRQGCGGRRGELLLDPALQRGRRRAARGRLRGSRPGTRRQVEGDDRHEQHHGA